jgi:carbon starvation protein CstA
MARCMENEKQGRRVFYGAMITEAIVAMIWATISMSFFGGIRELNEIMVAHQGNAAWVVNESANVLLGKFGAFLAILGVVAAPITSGDTAFRSARLIVADFLNLKQGPMKNRLYRILLIQLSVYQPKASYFLTFVATNIQFLLTINCL